MVEAIGAGVFPALSIKGIRYKSTTKDENEGTVLCRGCIDGDMIWIQLVVSSNLDSPIKSRARGGPSVRAAHGPLIDTSNLYTLHRDMIPYILTYS